MNGEAGTCAIGGGSVLISIIQLVIALVTLIAMWKVFVKAGKPGWAVIIPFFNAYVFLKIAGKPGWSLCFSNNDTSLETITLHVPRQHYS